MRFSVVQSFDHAADAVAGAYASRELYDAMHDLPKAAKPEVLTMRRDGATVVVELRHRFAGDLSAAARAVLDPARLSWVEHAVHDLATRSGTFTMRPDHYADRFRCEGTFRVDDHDSGARRRVEGELRVKAPLVAGAVERAIVSGLQEHLDDEVAVIDAYLRDPG